MILVIDNYDSFVYNLVQYLGVHEMDIRVYRNDEITIGEIRSLRPNGIVISPGPCSPNEAGISNQVIEEFAAEVPILGVCLGHQCIGAVFGASIKQAIVPKHGKLSQVSHGERFLFEGIENPLTVVRYHSLVIDELSMPDCLVSTAFSEEHEIMGVRHKVYDVEGIQFHPESVFTHQGRTIIKNFMSRVKMKGCSPCKIHKLPAF